MNRKLVLAIVIAIVLVMASYIFYSLYFSPKTASVEFEFSDKLIGAYDGKIYLLSEGKLIESDLRGKDIQILDSDIVNASINHSTGEIFYSQNISGKRSGTIKSLSDGTRKDYENATEIYWCGDETIIKILESSNKNSSSMKLKNINNSSGVVPVSVHDVIMSLNNKLIIIPEVESETENQDSIFFIYNPSNLQEEGDFSIKGNVANISQVGSRIIYNSGDQLNEIKDNNNTIDLKQSGDAYRLAGSQDENIIKLNNKENNLTIFVSEDGPFIKAGAFNTAKNNPASYDISNAVYDNKSGKIIFQSGKNIYSYKYKVSL